MLGRVTRAALVEQRPHPVFDAKAIMPRRDDIILVQDVAEEVAVIDFVDQRGVEIGGQRLEPGPVVTAQRDIARAQPPRLARPARAIAHRTAPPPDPLRAPFARPHPAPPPTRPPPPAPP